MQIMQEMAHALLSLKKLKSDFTPKRKQSARTNTRPVTGASPSSEFLTTTRALALAGSANQIDSVKAFTIFTS